MEKQPIGIFDSGVGGLTVFKSIRESFPHEDIVYFGDTARVPYGPKSKKTVIDYSIQNTRFLLQHNIKLLIIACNTSSSVAIPYIQKITSIPVIGVIVPGSEAALDVSRSKRIGIIGTEGTIKSNAYDVEIKQRDDSVFTYSKPCPLFVSLVEEGWIYNQATDIIIDNYLSEFKDLDIDTLVLGCTHYPVLYPVIKKYFKDKVELVDSSKAILKEVQKYVSDDIDRLGSEQFFVSDNEEKFEKIAKMILGKPITDLCRVALGESWFVE
jgi:glutamate racemase